MEIENFINELHNIKVHTQKRFDVGAKNCVVKNYIEREDLISLINQFKESSSSQFNKVYSSIV